MAALELVFVALAGVTMASLAKALSHKYIKRVPYTAKDGKRKYRYWYRLPGSGKLVSRVDLVVGAAFQAEGGHYHVTMAEDGKVTVKHDETGKEATLSHDALAALLHEEHKGKIAERGERLRRTLAEAEKVGNPKLVAARKKDLASHQDAYEPRPKEKEEPKPKAPPTIPAPPPVPRRPVIATRPPVKRGITLAGSRTKFPPVAKGDTILGTDGNVYVVTNIESQYIRDDGRSVGLDSDTGWRHQVYVAPAPPKKAAAVLAEEAKARDVEKENARLRQFVMEAFIKPGVMTSKIPPNRVIHANLPVPGGMVTVGHDYTVFMDDGPDRFETVAPTNKDNAMTFTNILLETLDAKDAPAHRERWAVDDAGEDEAAAPPAAPAPAPAAPPATPFTLEAPAPPKPAKPAKPPAPPKAPKAPAKPKAPAFEEVDHGGVFANKVGRNIVLTGNTYHIREQLKGIGATYDAATKGWKLSPEVYKEKSYRISKWAETAAAEVERERRVRAKQGGYRRSLESGDLRTGAALLREFAQRLGATMTRLDGKRGATPKPARAKPTRLRRTQPATPRTRRSQAATPKPARAPEWESQALAEAYGWQKERYAAHMERLVDLVTAQLEEWGVVT